MGKNTPNPFQPTASIGNAMVNKGSDVRSAKRALSLLGCYPAATSKIEDEDVENDADFSLAISAFERAYKVPSNGRIYPGSSFAMKLNKAVKPLVVSSEASPTTRPKVAEIGLSSAPNSGNGDGSLGKEKTHSDYRKVVNPLTEQDPAFGGWSSSDSIRKGMNIAKKASKNGVNIYNKLEIINDPAGRKKSIANNTPGAFEFGSLSEADSSSSFWEIGRLGRKAVEKHGKTIDKFADKYGVGSNLERFSSLWRSHYDEKRNSLRTLLVLVSIQMIPFEWKPL